MKLKPQQVGLHFYCGSVINIFSHTILPPICRKIFKSGLRRTKFQPELESHSFLNGLLYFQGNAIRKFASLSNSLLITIRHITSNFQLALKGPQYRVSWDEWPTTRNAAVCGATVDPKLAIDIWRGNPSDIRVYVQFKIFCSFQALLSKPLTHTHLHTPVQA
jgi:hypothetical protein